ncbi:MAG: hypothetical protein ACM31C_06590 [Acidobacteriota bacterium]
MASKTPDAAIGSDAKPVDGPSIDAATICDPTGTFDAPVPLTGYATALAEGTTRLSPDELTMYISGRFQGEPATDVNIYVATRASKTDNFGSPTQLANINSTANDWDPTVTSDGRMIVYGTTRTSGDATDLYVATRTSTAADFGTPGLLANVNSLPDDDVQPFITADGQELWFASGRSGGAGGHDIYRSAMSGGAFGAPIRVPELSTASDEWMPILSADKLTIYFGTNAAGTNTKGSIDIWTSHRATVTDAWPTPAPVPELNSTGIDTPAWLSADNCRLYFWSTGADPIGNVYVAVRHP